MMKEEKHTYRDMETKKVITNRLNRIEGQIKGVKKMVEKDCYCNDILIQLSAIQSAVKSLSNQLLENHLNTCICKNLQEGNTEVLEELTSLFKRFNK